uniref:Methyltranfer_dom domain-containing protein n=1 Tax=Steinernema glaseri TaxID=37863 RepID=A0A1I7Y4E9_9BILA
MIDHVIEKHWEKLPSSWKQYFDSLRSPQEYAVLFEAASTSVPPLGLLSLKSAVKRESIPRTPRLAEAVKLGNKLRVKIKQKKEHEITRIIALCEEVLLEAPMDEIVDLGAGLGHLSRILAHYLAEEHPERRILVSTVEGDSKLVESSRALDERFGKRVANDVDWKSPNREDAFIRCDEQLQQEGDDTSKILLGLHTCGDFSPTIIRYFANNSAARHLVHFGCCYHKLNGGADKLYAQVYDDQLDKCTEAGFPMSERYKNMTLSYAARELACHAQEQFVERIKRERDFSTFEVNCYRAVLEWIIVDKLGNEAARHQPVKSVKKAADFWEYAQKAVEGDLLQQINAIIEKDRAGVEEVVNTELQRIFSVYCLRLMLAPLVESTILRDRQAFLEEKGIQATLEAIFEPTLSPRNIALLASRG